MTATEASPQRVRPRLVATYEYVSCDGELLYAKDRFEPGFDGKKKSTPFKSPDGRGGWVKSYAGPHILYRLPALIAAAEAGSDTVFVVEGEKDADRLAALGITATTSDGGTKPWDAAYADHFRGLERVIVIADNDKGGQELGKSTVELLATVVPVVKYIECLPDVGEKGDVSDWLDAGGTLDELYRLAEEAPQWKPPDLLGDNRRSAGQGRLADLDARLPPSFWTERPAFAHIMEAARAQLVSPDAVLGAVLTRVAALTPHSVEVPGVVGSPVGLTFFAALCGPPAAGKSASSSVAADLLPAPSGFLDRLPIGSGEGLVDMLFELVDDKGDDKKPRKVKKQTRNAMILHVDEGAVLGDLGARRGSTLLATLRTAWTHGTLGNTNASIETRRILDGRSYVYGVTIAMQPEMAAPLLADTSAGTPQRIVWFAADDPDATTAAEPWPGPLDWAPPDTLTLDDHATTRGGWRRHPMGLAPEVAGEVREERAAVMRGDVDVEPIDSHGTLARLKVAALIALLDGRADISAEDWRLAGVVMASSRAVRSSIERALRGATDREERAAAERQARRELVVNDTHADRALASAAKSVGNVVHRHDARGDHKDQGGCRRTCLNQSIAGKHRDYVTVDEAASHAENKGWIAASGGLWKPGKSKPA